MATLVVATAATGAWRYFKIKDVLAQKLPPREFGRFSMRPLVALIFITAIATTTGFTASSGSTRTRRWIETFRPSP